jgi:hypothetical protein
VRVQHIGAPKASSSKENGGKQMRLHEYISARMPQKGMAFAKSGSGPLTDKGSVLSAHLIVHSAVTMAMCRMFSLCSHACCSAMWHSMGSAERAREVRKSA